MVTEATHADVERLKKISEAEMNNLREYAVLLNSIISNLEDDIVATRAKAKDFMRAGQKENYGHLMERIHETILRIETCRKCVDECEADLKHKAERIREYDVLLGIK